MWWGLSSRIVTEVKDKWKNLYSTAKKEFSSFQRESRMTGGGPAPKPISVASEKITEIFWRNTSFTQFAQFRGRYVKNVTVTKLIMWLTCSPPCLLLKECVNAGGFKVHGNVDRCKRWVFARVHFIRLLRIQPLHVGCLLGAFKISGGQVGARHEVLNPGPLSKFVCCKGTPGPLADRLVSHKWTPKAGWTPLNPNCLK